MIRNDLATSAVLAAVFCLCIWTTQAGAQEEFLPPPDGSDVQNATPIPQAPTYADSNTWAPDGHPGGCACDNCVGGHPYYSGGYGGNGGAYAGPPCGDCCACYGGGCNYYTPWTMQVSGLLMQRESPDEITLLFTNVGDPLVMAQDFQFDFEGGFDISIIHDHGSGVCGTEFRAMVMSDWEAQLQAQTLSPFIFTFPVTAIPNQQNITLNYTSELSGFELNYREKWTHAFTVIAGFRYLTLDERLTMTFVDPNVPNQPLTQTATWRTDNDMFGGQIGGMLQLWCDGGPLRIDAQLKAGAFLNDTHTRVAFRTDFGTGPFDGAADEGEAAFVGETSLFFTYAPSCNFAFRAGYQAMWVDGAVLASEQVISTGNLTAGNPIPLAPNAGSTLFHGVLIGLEYHY